MSHKKHVSIVSFFWTTVDVHYDCSIRGALANTINDKNYVKFREKQHDI